MFISMDLLIIAVMALMAIGLLALALTFLLRNKNAKRVCLYILVVLGAYIGYVGFRINWPGFLPQVILAVVLVLVSMGALVLERMRRDNDKLFLAAQIMASVALVAGMINAFA